MGMANPVPDLNRPARRLGFIRLKLEESPIFERMKSEGRTSTSPIKESFGRWTNLKGVLITLFGITTGMTVIWYTAQFYALFFIQSAMQVDYKASYTIFAIGLTIGTPLIVLFGALSDRIGRKPIMVTGLLLGALTLIPAFHALANYTNPGLSALPRGMQSRLAPTIAPSPCSQSPCRIATRQGASSAAMDFRMFPSRHPAAAS
jgi:MFS family permease